MQFATLHFVYFFTAVLTGSWMLRRVPVARKLLLLAASYYFYGVWEWKLLGLLAASSLWNWLAGEWTVRAESRGAKRAALIVAVTGNVGLLGFFKYYNFFRENVAEIASALGFEAHLPLLEVILPIGISYYTFQGLAYVIDLYRGYGHRAANLLDYLVFTAFFPQLLIGPICRSRDLLPQLEQMPTRVPNLDRAMALIAGGLFKKVIFSTYLATNLVDAAFLAPENYSSVELLAALYGYSIQLYLDFSGYTDIARGTALLMGFNLPPNFNNPYAAPSIGEFWRRWHMSFSYWLRDYIYFSFGGSRVPKFLAYINIFFTMLIGGLWHGAAWGYVMWGAIHGLALALYKISLDVRRGLGNPLAGREPFTWGRLPLLIIGWFYTFHICVFARVFFRSPDMQTAWVYLERIGDLTLYGRGLDPTALFMIVFGLALNFIGTPLQRGFIGLHARLPMPAKVLLWMILGILLLTLKPSEVPPYIYFKF
ncbi:MBOAT family protein [bacterium]|nr:MBOAT family protein [bacterium]